MRFWPTRAATVVALIAVAGCGGDEAPSSEPTPPAVAQPGEAPADVGPLLAWIEASPLIGAAPLTVELQADLEGGTAPRTQTWSFGDGETSTAKNPTHVYTKAGTYEVRLDAQDARAGTADSDWDIIEVVVTE